MILGVPFVNMLETIKTEILNCHKSIRVYIDWFSNKELIGLLADKAKCGLDIKIIARDKNKVKQLHPKELIKDGGILKIITTKEYKSLQYEFMIFDSKTIIYASYDWTLKYKKPEYLNISKEAYLIKQFSVIFNYLFERSVDFQGFPFGELTDLEYEKTEKEIAVLERDLKADLLYIWHESGKIDKNLQNHFIPDFVEIFGSIGTCKRLMNHYGIEKFLPRLIKLWKVGRLDLSIEAVITKVKYKDLLEEDTINIAKARIDKFYKGKELYIKH